MADIQKCKIGESNPDAVMFDTYKESVVDGTTCYDIGSDECWDAYSGEEQVWHKDKTFENYYKGKGLATTYEQSSGGTVYMSSEVLSASTLDDSIKDKSLAIKPITDLEDHIYSYADDVMHGLVFHVKPVNKEEFWTPIKEWLANNYVACHYLWYSDGTNYYRSGRFGNSNIYGEVTLNFDNVDGVGYNNSHIALYYPFRNCSGITKLTLHVKDTTQNLCWTSMNSAFCGLSGCTELAYDGVPNTPSDVSDCFSGCKFTTWPRNLIDYRYINISNYMIDSGSIQVVPLCSLSDDREAACNTLKIKGNQIFNCGWTDIMPCLDASGYTGGNNTFGYNGGEHPYATNVRIKNWNCNYSFDGKKSDVDSDITYCTNLPNLDAESVGYLLENLTDLTAYDAELRIDNSLHSFKSSSWIYSATSYSVESLVMNKRVYAYQFCTTNTATGTLKINISGMQTGDVLTLADDNTTFATITENGDYDIEISSRSGWLLWRLQNSTDSTITNTVIATMRKPYTAGAPFASSGKLYVPEKWEATYDAVEGNDFDTLVASAVAKGWTVYVGGTERGI